jgi:hypothetical protein
MLMANSANTKFLNDLTKYNLLGREIKPGETFSGFVGINTLAYNNITVKLAGQ